MPTHHAPLAADARDLDLAARRRAGQVQRHRLARPHAQAVAVSPQPRRRHGSALAVGCATHPVGASRRSSVDSAGGADERSRMIDLYTAPTPNGWKASITLEELELPYEVHIVNLLAGDQKTARVPEAQPERPHPDHRRPRRGRLRRLRVGRDPDLPRREDRPAPADRPARAARCVIQWLMFQMGGIGPMMGQANVFFRYFPEKIQPAIDRYQNECRRLFEVLDGAPRRARVARRRLLDRRHRQLVLGAHPQVVGRLGRRPRPPAALDGTRWRRARRASAASTCRSRCPTSPTTTRAREEFAKGAQTLLQR